MNLQTAGHNNNNPNPGGLFRGSFSGGRGRKIAPYLKLVRIILEPSNFACKYTHTCLVSENIPFNTKRTS